MAKEETATGGAMMGACMRMQSHRQRRGWDHPWNGKGTLSGGRVNVPGNWYLESNQGWQYRAKRKSGKVEHPHLGGVTGNVQSCHIREQLQLLLFASEPGNRG